jgi:hypothetical protein
VAREPMWIRTVTVRLRRVVLAGGRDPIARRLLVVAGVAVAGWLLGGAGSAHADTSAARPAVGTPPAVLGTVSDIAAAENPSPDAGRRAVGRSGSRFDRRPDAVLATALGTRTMAAPALAPVETSVPGASSLRKVRDGLAGPLREAERVLPVHPLTVLDLPGVAWPADADLASTGPWPGGAGADLSWTPRQRHGADAGIGDRSRMGAPGPLALSGASKGGRATLGVALSHPAPVPGAEFPHPLSPPANVLLRAAGPTLTGGELAHLAGPGGVPWPSRLPVPPRCVVGPAVRSATDEPSCSPD